MMESIHLDDPTDWPDTWSPMNQLDQALRCSICSEFFKTAMILLHCSHNFCSLCIRKRIAIHPSCPLCHKEVHESDLRPNRLINELIDIVCVLRDRFLNTPSPPTPPNPTLMTTTSTATFSLPTPSSISTLVSTTKKPTTTPTTIPAHPSRVPSLLSSFRSSSSSSSSSPSSSSSLMGSTDTRARLPTPHFHTLTLKDLNALLQRQQLPTTGTRLEKIQRYKDYLKYYHANLDALPHHRVSNAQLRASVLAIQPNTTTPSSSSSSSVVPPSLHLKKYFNEFQQLREQASRTVADTSAARSNQKQDEGEQEKNNEGPVEKEEKKGEEEKRERAGSYDVEKEQEKEDERNEPRMKRFKKN